MIRSQSKEQQHPWQDELFRLVVESSKDYSILIIDREGFILAWNPGAEQTFGYTADEMIGASIERIYTPADLAHGIPAREIQTALARGRSVDERWHVGKGGKRLWGSGVMVPLRDELGDIRGLAKVLRDFTDSKNTQEALRESEERLRVALSAAQMGTWLWNVETDRQTIDDSLKRLMGMPLDERPIALEDFIAAIHPEDRASVRGAFDRSLREGVDLSVEFRVVWPDGQIRWLRDQGKVLQDGDDGGGKVASMTGACVDITERKQLEEALEQRAEELAEASRRKDEFLAMLGHELRNPLAPIRNVLEVLRHTTLSGERLHRAYATIDRQVEHLTRLVDDLLDVSRITRGKIQLHVEPVDVGSIMTNAAEAIRPVIEGRGQSLTVSLPREALVIPADATRLAQILTNLLNNAVKYTGPGGQIWLEGERAGSDVVLRVRDTGAGIAPELLPKVFDLFMQGDQALDRAQGGLGIGLTLVRRLVEMHGGSAEARSAGIGRGSEIVVRLPMQESGVVSSSRIAPAGAASSTAEGGEAERPRRVLVVDDNRDVAESLAMLLDELGHEVKMAHEGHSAVEVARKFEPDVVILDIGLPGMDGYEVARELRRQPALRDTRILALSGYGQEEDRRRSREAGFDHHLVKPVSANVLQSLVEAPFS